MKEPSLIRLIDLLDGKGVIESPISNSVSNPAGFARDCPNLAQMAGKFPLLDMGAGKNPLLLKKKIRIGRVEYNAILAPPTSVFRFRVRIPHGAVLEFSCGICWGNDPARKSGVSREADFSVRLRGHHEPDLTFQDKVILTGGQISVLKPGRVDLARLAGQEVDLEFATHGRPDTPAFWSNPVIFRPQANATNVILISLDTLRADHLSCYGYGRATSPNLDRLAAESVLFKNTFASSPWTLPSHVSLLTGLDEVNHRVYRPTDRMDPSIPTLADYLRQSGFVTAAMTGGGFVKGHYGFSKGFDSFRVVGKLVSNDLAEQLAGSALPWIEDNRSKKFFLFLHTYQIHQPYSTPAPFNKMFLDSDAALDHVNLAELELHGKNRFQPATDALRRNYIGLYDAEVRYTDEALIGAVVGQLKRLGLYDRTMIIVTSDHGEEFFEHKAWLHGHSLYNETIMIPLLIKLPGSRSGGIRVDRIARLTDVMPTILEEMGLDYPRDSLDGRSLLALVRDHNDQGPERTFRSELAANVSGDHVPHRRALNRGDFKIIVSDPFTPEQLAYFMYPPPNQGRLEVYDLAADPGETQDLASSRPDLARSMLKYLEDVLKPTAKIAVRTSEAGEDVQEELKALGYIH